LRQVEALADLAVGQALGDELEDLALLLGEPGQLVLLAVADAVEHPGGHRRVEQRLAPADPPDGVDQVGALHLLEQVAGGAGHDRRVDRVVVGERRQHDAGDLGVARADVAADLDAVAVGQPHVAHRDVGARGGDAGQRFLGGARLADDLQVVLGLEELADPPADDLVVVEQEHSCHGASMAASSASSARATVTLTSSAVEMGTASGHGSARAAMAAAISGVASDGSPPRSARARMRSAATAGSTSHRSSTTSAWVRWATARARSRWVRSLQEASSTTISPMPRATSARASSSR